MENRIEEKKRGHVGYESSYTRGSSVVSGKEAGMGPARFSSPAGDATMGLT